MSATPRPPAVTVYCGSRHGARSAFTDAARALGSALVDHGFELVYGGGHVGLMGEVADSVRSAGGRVTGVITEHLYDLEVAHDELDELVVTADMPSRKAEMFERGDAFVALPGGVGTLEELFEVLCWSTLDLHPHPIGLLNVDGFWQPLLAMLDHMNNEGFLRAERVTMLVDDDPQRLVGALADLCNPRADP